MADIVKIRLSDKFKDKVISSTRKNILDKSMRKDQANLVGSYGEQIVIKYLSMIGVECNFCDKTTHDIQTKAGRIEVKTKERTVEPRPFYDCTVPAYNHEHQTPDWFVFVSLLSNGHTNNKRFDRAFILGAIDLPSLQAKAKLWKVGMVDLSNGWKPTIDCYNIKISDLKTVKESIGYNSSLRNAVNG